MSLRLALVFAFTCVSSVAAADVVCGPPAPGVDFYAPPPIPPKAPLGTILRCELVDSVGADKLSAEHNWKVSVAGGAASKFGYRHYRILYVSQGPIGKPALVSATVYLPTTNDRCDATTAAPIVAVQHGTTGLADACAPSRNTDWFDYMAVPLLGRGMAIVATDYQGLGTPGVHPYLVGESEGFSVLDGLRALGKLRDPAIATGCLGHEVVLIGHSQGGQATLFAEKLAPSYGLGDGMHLAGAVAWAPAIPTRFVARGKARALPADMKLSAGFVFYLLYLFGEDRYHGAPADAAWLTPEAAKQLPAIIEKDCLPAVFSDVISAFPTAGVLFSKEFLANPDAEPWATYADADVSGNFQTTVPTLIVQGTDDNLVSPSGVHCMVDRMTAAHDPVSTCALPGGHISVVPASWKHILPWIEAVAHGGKAPALPAECAGVLPACPAQ